MAYLLQHEMDDEPSYIVDANDPDTDLITVAPGNYELARRIVELLNTENLGEQKWLTA